MFNLKEENLNNSQSQFFQQFLYITGQNLAVVKRGSVRMDSLYPLPARNGPARATTRAPADARPSDR
jgi:hypothetical protein